MKLSKTIYTLILVFSTMFMMWVLPELVKRMTDDSKGYPLMYYSARLKELCMIDFRTHKDSFFDIRGNEYPRSQYDSLLPLMNFRQLAMNGTMPDSIDGHAMDMKTLRTKQVLFRFRPADVFSPLPSMGVLLEAMPKRGNLLLPGDYFRMNDHGIEFVDAETNEVNTAKSRTFTQAMEKKGFSFPARAWWGNPTVRKPYEEGYFCQDSKGSVFHLKMVNGRPFVKDTKIDHQVAVKWFVMSEVVDKRFYGYVFGEKGEFGILESSEGGDYRFLPMEVRPIDIQKDEISILGNMLYWTVKVIDKDGMDCYGLDVNDLQALSSYHQDRKEVLWDKVSQWLFPVVLSPQVAETGYVGSYLVGFSPKACLLGVIMAVMGLFICGKSLTLRKKIVMSVFILFTGISGVIALLFFPMKSLD